MKPSSLICFLAVIVIIFLLQGAHIIYGIELFNKEMLNSSQVDGNHLKILMMELNKFQYFIYLFAALIAVIVHPFIFYCKKCTFISCCKRRNP